MLYDTLFIVRTSFRSRPPLYQYYFYQYYVTCYHVDSVWNV